MVAQAGGTFPSNTSIPSASSAVPPPSESGPTQPASVKSKVGVSAGGVAGIVVGVAIAAALLGSIVAYYLFRLSHKSRSSDPSGDEPKDPEPVSLDKHLPQPAEDSKLRDDAGYLSELIDQHVLNYYHLAEVSSVDLKTLDAAVPKERGFRKAGVGVGVVADAETRFVGLKQYLAAMILFCVAPHGNPECTFLSSEEVAFLKAVPERDGDPVFYEAYNQWRVLSSYLLHATTATATSSFSEPTTLDHSIHQVFDDIDRVLLPFAIAATEADRRAGLLDILHTAAKLGRLLFAQKEEWVFSWVLRGKRGKHVESGRGVVVFPALLRGDGRVVRPLDMEKV